MSTINIFIECNKKSRYLNVFITRDENSFGIYRIYGRKENFLSISLFGCFSASDVMTDVAKQYKHYDVDTGSLLQREREKKHKYFGKPK